ncbi:hypothetical protein [Arenimonas donghaensis]|uniref:hypothetical protein n=1 Tax=Arenimonas donghaensis TaxID=375061 RepID=UPI0012679C14|nr:hypothetical protein [Arenimonas donghaensis]
MIDPMLPRTQSLPRKHGIVLRLLVLFLAVALAVGLQAGEGQAAGPVERSAPATTPDAPMPACTPPVALRHPALPAAAQPRDARNSDDSKGCSRSARPDS